MLVATCQQFRGLQTPSEQGQNTAYYCIPIGYITCLKFRGYNSKKVTKRGWVVHDVSKGTCPATLNTPLLIRIVGMDIAIQLFVVFLHFKPEHTTHGSKSKRKHA